ncbi:TatD family hydrolase [Aeromicrobium sp. IC_218]|uniref:TatD family hydrolase n=1 Tax=Aeromicrobium sp. IC_218 TaxID=2545468 RepID=UPI00103AB8BB|nr:TatD family hydrolase [Aeromicrobium sp. IC_218]TCI97400.1 TatD family deoxyribonuclease [Aeromicrobium sp. IC_218]
MSRELPPLDLHAHIDVGVGARDLESLGAVVFVATRTLEKSAAALTRSDAVTIWGVGCHPGVPAAQDRFDVELFRYQLAQTAFISEVGLDGGSKVPMDRQVEVFTEILGLVAQAPRIVSVHSARATTRTLDVIEQTGARGVILHWWLGSDRETKRAIDLGCFFSVNPSMDPRRLATAGVPLERLLPETDHPSGNRRGASMKQPGWTSDVEASVARAYGLPEQAVRRQFWKTLAALVDALDVEWLLPPVVCAMLDAARRSGE